MVLPSSAMLLTYPHVQALLVVFLVMIPLGAIVGLLLAGVATYVMPKKYESETTIEVKPGIAESNINLQRFGTEFEKIKSSVSLGKVVENLGLTNKWGVDRQTAIRKLKGILTIQNIRGTDLISIQVRHTNKEDARDIAAEVTRVYRDDRTEIHKQAQEMSRLAFRKTIRDLEDQMESLRQVRASASKTYHLLHYDSPQPAENVLSAADLADANRDLAITGERLKDLKIKQLNDSILGQLSSKGIDLHEEPRITQLPVSPNVTLNLVLGLFGGLLLSPLLALPVMILLNRSHQAKAR